MSGRLAGTNTQLPVASTMAQKSRAGMLLDPRRKMQIASAGPVEHTDEVRVLPNPKLSIDDTIFYTADESLKPYLQERFCVELFWSDGAIARIEKDTAGFLEACPSWQSMRAHDPALIKWMETECSFKIEHADGSFLDHLQYGYEFCTAHMPQYSAMPLFLHSIMGVGTNLFPMMLEQKDDLAAFLTEDELDHIQIFPSAIRVLGNLTDELMALVDKNEAGRIQEFECYRLIGPDMSKNMRSDNKPLTLTAEQLWVHLNYHLIHTMDFLPVTNWEEKALEIKGFSDLHLLLKKAGKLYCNMKFDSEKWSALAAAAGKADPEELAKGEMYNDFFSGQIGHRREFKLKLAPSMATARL